MYIQEDYKPVFSFHLHAKFIANVTWLHYSTPRSISIHDDDGVDNGDVYSLPSTWYGLHFSEEYKKLTSTKLHRKSCWQDAK